MRDLDRVQVPLNPPVQSRIRLVKMQNLLAHIYFHKQDLTVYQRGRWRLHAGKIPYFSPVVEKKKCGNVIEIFLILAEMILSAS